MATFTVTLDDGTSQVFTADIQVNSSASGKDYVEFISAATGTPQSVARFVAVNVTNIVKQ